MRQRRSDFIAACLAIAAAIACFAASAALPVAGLNPLAAFPTVVLGTGFAAIGALGLADLRATARR